MGASQLGDSGFMDDQDDSTEKQGATGLFQPDTLIPAQYLETIRRKSHPEPEKRLILAVLEDTVSCFQENVLSQTGREKVLFQQAQDWIMEEHSDRIFSFEKIASLF